MPRAYPKTEFFSELDFLIIYTPSILTNQTNYTFVKLSIFGRGTRESICADIYLFPFGGSFLSSLKGPFDEE